MLCTEREITAIRGVGAEMFSIQKNEASLSS